MQIEEAHLLICGQSQAIMYLLEGILSWSKI